MPNPFHTWTDDPARKNKYYFPPPKAYETVDSGARQQRLLARYDLVPPIAIRLASELLHRGEQEYGKDNWRGITVDSHLNHALGHIFQHLGGDKTEDHLVHAMCRLLFAVELANMEKTNDD